MNERLGELKGVLKLRSGLDLIKNSSGHSGRRIDCQKPPKAYATEQMSHEQSKLVQWKVQSLR